MGVVHASSGHLVPLSASLLSEPAIVARMAKASLSDTTLNWAELIKDYDGGTLMEAYCNPIIEYSTLSETIKKQKEVN